MAGRNVSGRFMFGAATLLETDLTPEKRDAVRQKLGPLERTVISANLKDWCPVEEVVQVHKAIHSICTDDDETRVLFTRLGEIMANQATGTFLRLFMKIATPPMLFKQLPKIWPKYADFGNFEFQVLTSTRFESLMRDVGSMTYLPVMTHGWMATMLRMVAKDKLSLEFDPDLVFSDPAQNLIIKDEWS